MNAFSSSRTQSACRFLIAVLALGTTSQGTCHVPGRTFFVATNGTDNTELWNVGPSVSLHQSSRRECRRRRHTVGASRALWRSEQRRRL